MSPCQQDSEGGVTSFDSLFHLTEVMFSKQHKDLACPFALTVAAQGLAQSLACTWALSQCCLNHEQTTCWPLACGAQCSR